LAVETAFQVAREQTAAVLHILAVPSVADDATHCERLHDDLIAFARISQRYGIALDGELIVEPSVERITEEIRKRKINLIVIAKPAGKDSSSELSRLLDTVSQATGVPATVVRGGP